MYCDEEVPEGSSQQQYQYVNNADEYLEEDEYIEEETETEITMDVESFN